MLLLYRASIVTRDLDELFISQSDEQSESTVAAHTYYLSVRN